MLQQYITNLNNSIHSAQRCSDVDVYRLAQQRMDELLTYLSQLPLSMSEPVYEAIDAQLPSDWPLWMETCRPLNNDCIDYDWMDAMEPKATRH